MSKAPAVDYALRIIEFFGDEAGNGDSGYMQFARNK